MRDPTPSGAPDVASADSEVARLARELADLRAKVERLSADAPSNGHEARRSAEEGSVPPRRRLGRRRGRSRTISPGEGEAVSRRRLLGLAGTAAAAGVGGALLAGSPSEATSGSNVVIDGNPTPSTANAGSGTTYLTSDGNGAAGNTYSGFTLDVQSTKTDGGAIKGTTNGNSIGVWGNTTAGAAVQGQATSGAGVLGQSGTGPSLRGAAPGPNTSGVHLQLDRGPVTGPPTADFHFPGQFWVDSDGKLFYCVVAGIPGTWVNLASPLVTIPPARVYDSRVGQQPATLPKLPIVNNSTVNLDVTGTQANPPGGPSGVPTGAKSVLGNITLVNGPNPVFLTVFARGATPPATSNINANGGQVIANNFTSQIGTSNGINIECGGGPTDFIIDIFGYYP